MVAQNFKIVAILFSMVIMTWNSESLGQQTTVEVDAKQNCFVIFPTAVEVKLPNGLYDVRISNNTSGWNSVAMEHTNYYKDAIFWNTVYQGEVTRVEVYHPNQEGSLRFFMTDSYPYDNFGKITVIMKNVSTQATTQVDIDTKQNCFVLFPTAVEVKLPNGSYDVRISNNTSGWKSVAMEYTNYYKDAIFWNTTYQGEVTRVEVYHPNQKGSLRFFMTDSYPYDNFGKITVTITPVAPPSSITVTSNPIGRTIQVDGSDYTTPRIFTWTVGSQHTLNAPSPQSGGSGIRYIFSSWSDGGSQSRTITVPSGDATYIANFTTQYQLTVAVIPSGAGSITVNPQGPWYNSGTSVTLTATPIPGNTFSNWSGDISGTNPIATVVMSGPKSVVANFTPETDGPPPISPNAPQEVPVGQEFFVDIMVGSSTKSVTDLKVVSFEMLYTNTTIIDYLSYEVGSFLTAAQATVVSEDPNGKVSASVYRTTGGNSGSGVVLRLKFKILDTAPANQTVVLSFGGVQANDVNGNTISLSPTTATVRVTPPGLFVWPGDANNDLTVNIFDINSIVAIHWNRSGAQRPNASLQWIGQPCPPWTPPEAAYADCDGNGAINIFDINAVVVNFGKTHPSGSGLYASETARSENSVISSLADVSADPPILSRGPQHVDRNQEFWIEIEVGAAANPVTNVKVVSFELLYTNTAIIDYLSYEVGPFLTAAQATVIPEDQNGKISASVYKTAGANSGSGILLRLKFKVRETATIGQTIVFTFGGVQANRDDGSVQPLSPVGHSMLLTSVAEIGSDLPTEFALLQNYPNPFNPETEIQYGLPKPTYVILRIFNAAGQEIRTLVDGKQPAGFFTIRWDGKDNFGRQVNSGLYFYTLRAGEFSETHKALLLR